MSLLRRLSFGRDEQFLTRATVSGALGTGVAVGLTWLLAGRFSFDGALAGAAVGVLVGASRWPLAVRLLASVGAWLFSIIGAPSVTAGEVAVGTLALALAVEARSWGTRLATFVAVCVGGLWGWAVTRAFAMPHLHAPWLAMAAPLADGLFLGLGAWLGSVRVAPDAVSPRLEFISGAGDAWSRVRRARAKLPAFAPLTTLLSVGVERLIVAGHALDELRIDEPLEAVTRDAVAALTARLGETDDEELRQHLSQTLRVHRDVLEQLDTLKRKKERAAAQVRAHVSWLETVAFSLETVPAGAQALDDLTERLKSLSPGERLSRSEG